MGALPLQGPLSSWAGTKAHKKLPKGGTFPKFTHCGLGSPTGHDLVASSFGALSPLGNTRPHLVLGCPASRQALSPQPQKPTKWS